MSTIVITTVICRLAYDNPEHYPVPSDKAFWFPSRLQWQNVKNYTWSIIPICIFILALPLALKTTVSRLKYYSRALFALQCCVFVLVLVILFVFSKQPVPRGA